MVSVKEYQTHYYERRPSGYSDNLIMGTDRAILKTAISEVDQERSYLSAEQAAFEEFREAVRLATPDTTADTGPSETTENLREKYREEVMDRLDYGQVYGDSLAESLEQELSPAIADVLMSEEPLTQRRKRNLLVKTTVAIERREEFLEELDKEQTALETCADELADIDSSLKKLPKCSPRQQLLEDLLDIWKQYNTLEERCNRLLERRQQQIRDARRSVRLFGDQHALNDYLYGGLETSYPVLTATLTMVKRINSNQTGRELSETMYRQKTN